MSLILIRFLLAWNSISELSRKKKLAVIQNDIKNVWKQKQNL